MKATNIEWTDFSSNPVQYRDAAGKVVWACVKKSSGCANCYSEAIAQRFERGGPFTKATMEKLTPFLDEKELRHILTAKQISGKPVAGSKCFLGDMTDVFGEWVPDELLDRLFAALALRPDVTFQILTKRPERMARYFADGHRNGRGWHTSIFVARHMSELAALHGISADKLDEVNGLGDKWSANIWAGTSVENQAAADERIPHLRNTPAAVRFLSCEPLLGPVTLGDIGDWICFRGLRKLPPAIPEPLPDGDYCGRINWQCERPTRCDNCEGDGSKMLRENHIHWVIVGGESGPGARPMQLEWARSLVAQCKAAGVPAFCKQMGSQPVERRRIVLNEGESLTDLVPLCGPLGKPLKDKKGGDIGEFPADLQVREFPPVTTH